MRKGSRSEIDMPIPAEAPTKLRSLSTVEYREAMSRLGAAVSVITTDGPAGPSGFTASAVCSVTDAPPTLLVCLNRSASASPLSARSPPSAIPGSGTS